MTNTRQNSDGPVEIRIARTIEEVEALRDVWTFWGGHRDSDIDMVLMVVRSYPEVLRPHVIALYRDGRPNAILIGRLEKKRLPFKIGYLTVCRPTVRRLNFVYGALRGNASVENAELLIREAIRCLQNGEADLCFFEFTPIESPLYQKALSLPGLLSRDVRPATQLHDVMEIPESVESIYQRMSSKSRGELRRKTRKLYSHPDGELKIVCYREAADLPQLFKDVEQVAKNTYQRGLGAGFSDTPLVRERLGLGARKGWLRAYVQYIGKRPIAFWIGMLYRDTFFGEYLGFDTAFRAFAPGMALMMKGIEGFCERANGDNVKKLDFGPGHADYKEIFSSHTWTEAPVFIYAPTLRGAFLKFVQFATKSIERLAGKVLHGTALAKIKRFWRDRLAHKSRTESRPNVEPAKGPSPDPASSPREFQGIGAKPL